MKGKSSKMLACLIVAAMFGAIFAAEPLTLDDLEPGLHYEPGEILIGFAADRNLDAFKDRIALAEGAQRLSLNGVAERWRVADDNIVPLVKRLSTLPGVRYAEPNYKIYLSAAPNDTFYPQQWALENTGQDGGTPNADINAENAWDTQTGSSNVVVAVIDTGIWAGHPDLSANMWTNPNEIPGNGIDDDNCGYVDDPNGWDWANDDANPTDDHFHGTHVAGTIGAVADNGTGVAGVVWDVSLLGLKFLGANGSGLTSDAVLAVDYATCVGVDVINASWGGAGFSQALKDAIQAAGNAGISFVAAAGNNGDDLDLFTYFPAAYDVDSIITVAATDRNDELAGFSNYGAGSVELAAPGVDILSTYLPSADPDGDGYESISGTSMAAPHVAGAAAWLISENPGMTWVEVKSAIMSHVDPLASLQGQTISGGRLNMNMQGDNGPPGTLNDVAVAQALSDGVSVTWTATGGDGNVGFASRYDIRYSTSMITAQNFDSAAAVPGIYRASVSGTTETFDIPGFAASTSYYLAVKVIDGWGNVGGMSNVASFTTLPNPSASISPGLLSITVPYGTSASDNFVVSNSSAGSLDWVVVDVDAGVDESQSQSSLCIETCGQDAQIVQAVDVPTGPWAEATDLSGRIIGSGSDNLGIDFNAISRGAGLYQGTVTVETNDPLNPTDTLDLSMTVTGAPQFALALDLPSGRLSEGNFLQLNVCEGGPWEDFEVLGFDFPFDAADLEMDYAAGAPFVFNGEDFGYLDLRVYENAGSGLTYSQVRVGEVTNGALFSCYECAVNGEPFGIDPDLLFYENSDGQVLFNSSIDTEFETCGILNWYSHRSRLRIRPDFYNVDFGAVNVGSSASIERLLENLGTTDLQVTSLSATGPFSVDVTSATVSAGDADPVNITFSPTASGVSKGQLRIYTDDPVRPLVIVELSGFGGATNSYGVDAASLEFLVEDDYVANRLELWNGYANAASYDITIQYFGAQGLLRKTVASGSIDPASSVDVGFLADSFTTPTGNHSGRILVQFTAPTVQTIMVPFTVNERAAGGGGIGGPGK